MRGGKRIALSVLQGLWPAYVAITVAGFICLLVTHPAATAILLIAGVCAIQIVACYDKLGD